MKRGCFWVFYYILKKSLTGENGLTGYNKRDGSGKIKVVDRVWLRKCTGLCGKGLGFGLGRFSICFG